MYKIEYIVQNENELLKTQNENELLKYKNILFFQSEIYGIIQINFLSFHNFFILLNILIIKK